MDALLAPAVRVQAGPLVAPFLHLGLTATGGAEAVPAVPGQHRPRLCHDACQRHRDSSGLVTFPKLVLHSLELWL